MLTALTAHACPLCSMPIDPGDGTDYIDNDLCCEDCVISHQYATSGL